METKATTPAGRTGSQLALAESQNIPQTEQAGTGVQQAKSTATRPSTMTIVETPPAAPPLDPVAAEALGVHASPVAESTQQGHGVGGGSGVSVEADAEGSGVASQNADALDGAADSLSASLALARQLLEEEAMASYRTVVDYLRGDDGSGGGGMDGVAEEDMAVMRALMAEDEEQQQQQQEGTRGGVNNALAMSEEESLDYDGMLELGDAIGDVRKERWRLRCTAVIAALPRVSYTADGSSTGEGDTKCLVCQCEYEEKEEVMRLPCDHVFHTGCVDGWLEENEECPTCRRSISP